MNELDLIALERIHFLRSCIRRSAFTTRELPGWPLRRLLDTASLYTQKEYADEAATQAIDDLTDLLVRNNYE